MDKWFFFCKQFATGDNVRTTRQVSMEDLAIRKKNRQHINIPRGAVGCIINGSQTGFAPYTYVYDVQFDGLEGHHLPEYLLERVYDV